MSADTDINDPSPAPLLIPAKLSIWRRMGGGSLALSIIVHVILLVIGVVWVVKILPVEKAKQVDFMPLGGGGGEVGAKSDPNARKRMASNVMPVSRVAAMNSTSGLTLPDPDPSSSMSPLANLGGSSMAGGLGGAGSGGGRGNGHGRGFGDGNGLGRGGNGKGPSPFAGVMFGNEIKAESIGVVLDVSGSMVPHLPKVIAELDRVAAGSPLILYVGCGIAEGRPKSKSFPTVDIDSGISRRFERFWRLNHDMEYKPNKTLEDGSAKIDVDFSRPMPQEAVYKILSTRPNTYYLDYEGVQFAWGALLCKPIKDVEAVYWFADFQDSVDGEEAKKVARKLRGNKQKLYIQVSGKGPNVPVIQEEMIKPTDGGIIEVK